MGTIISVYDKKREHKLEDHLWHLVCNNNLLLLTLVLHFNTSRANLMMQNLILLLPKRKWHLRYIYTDCCKARLLLLLLFVVNSDFCTNIVKKMP